MNNLTEIEKNIQIANELIAQTTQSVEIIQRLISVVNQYQETIDKAFNQNKDMIETLAECVEQRDRARATAVRLEQECHSCTNKDHHA